MPSFTTWTRRAGTVLAAAAVSLSLATALPATSYAKTPDVPKNLPAAIEAPARYVAANTCDPGSKPGALKLAKLLVKTYPGTSYGIGRTCGTDTIATSEHYEGRAVDWMTSVRTKAGKKRANDTIKWMLATDSDGNKYANARRLGIMYIIWDNKIFGLYNPVEGWRDYNGCTAKKMQSASLDTTCHRNHIHFSLSWEGAQAHTSFWSGKVTAPDYGPCRPADLNWAPRYTRANPIPCGRYDKVKAPEDASANLKALVKYSGMDLRFGSSGPVVKAVQKKVGAPQTGTYGDTTVAKVKKWQSTKNLKETGKVNADTWRTLIGVKVTTSAATTPVKPGAGAPTPTKPSVDPLVQYETATLEEGSRGAAVKALQNRLDITADGWFGPQTAKSVRAFQKSHHLAVDGVVNTDDWKALEKL